LTKCKKYGHGGKLKSEHWFEKQHRGGALLRVGCVDCKAEAARAGFKSPGPAQFIKVLNPAWVRRRT
jgi:hypothetical protein